MEHKLMSVLIYYLQTLFGLFCSVSALCIWFHSTILVEHSHFLVCFRCSHCNAVSFYCCSRVVVIAID